jgi:hypothetical protein
MNISEESRNMIVKEIDYIASKMQKAATPEEKLYYFSATYGLINRVVNFEYDDELIFLHFVLQQAYMALQQRLVALTKGGDSIIPLTEKHFDKLLKTTKELGKKIKQGEEITGTLKEFVILAYTTTGNGYYLLGKGIIKI